MKTRTKVLVTGGCGFIGSNLIRMILRDRPAWEVINLDALTYAGNLANLADVAEAPHYRFVKGDICDRPLVHALLQDQRPDVIINVAAETHVDRSIQGPESFIHTNVHGTFSLLQELRGTRHVRFVQISTDEVYGSLGSTGRFTETSCLNPSSPYSASKAAADMLVMAYHRTYGLDALITRCSNNYGPYQFPEKLIPLMVINAIHQRPLPVYGTGLNVRDWIHVEDHCRGVLAAVERGKAGETYNLGGETERTNLEIVERIADQVGQRRDLITFVADRPGHDLRYAMDIRKAQAELGWSPATSFERGLDECIDWYKRSQHWWQPLLDKRL